MPDFHFKPAPLRNAIGYQVEIDRIVRLSDGEECRFSEVTTARHVRRGVGQMEMERLDLHCGKRLFRVAQNRSLRTPDDDSDLNAYRGCLLAVAEQLALTNSAVRIELGEGGKARWALFGLGLFSLLAALGLLAAALITGVSNEKLMDGLIPISILAVLGGWVGHAFRPWRPRIRIPPRVFADAMRKTIVGVPDIAGDR